MYTSFGDAPALKAASENHVAFGSAASVFRARLDARRAVIPASRNRLQARHVLLPDEKKLLLQEERTSGATSPRTEVAV
jgi:hypothetical protein